MENTSSLTIISMAYEGPDYPLWSPLTSGWVLGLVGVAGLITLATKAHFIHYVLTYAPKRRPLNQLFLYDQVRDDNCAAWPALMIAFFVVVVVLLLVFYPLVILKSLGNPKRAFKKLGWPEIFEVWFLKFESK
jgi:hypothetical protein